MSEITRIGVDLAKNVIQVRGVDAAGKVVTLSRLVQAGWEPQRAVSGAALAAARQARA